MGLFSDKKNVQNRQSMVSSVLFSTQRLTQCVPSPEANKMQNKK